MRGMLNQFKTWLLSRAAKLEVNDEQLRGVAGVLDNFAVVAIGGSCVIFFGFGDPAVRPGHLFALSLVGIGSLLFSFYLRKRLSS